MNVGEIYTRFVLDTGDFKAKIGTLTSDLKNIGTATTATTKPIITIGDALKAMGAQAGTIPAAMAGAAGAIKKSEGPIQDVKKAWAEMSIAVAGALYIFNTLSGYVQKIIAFGEAGAKVERTELAFAAVAKQAGLMGTEVVAGLQKASRGMMDATDIMGKAGRLIQENIPVATLNSIMESLAKQAPVVGDTLPEAWDKFGDALSRGTLRSMKAYVGMVDMEEEYRKYAKSVGVATASLSDEHKQMILAEVMAARLKEQVKGLGQEFETSSERIQKAKTRLQEVKETMQKEVAPIVATFYELWAKINEGFLTTITRAETKQKEYYAAYIKRMGIVGLNAWDEVMDLPQEKPKIQPKAMTEEYLEGLRKMALDSKPILESDTKNWEKWRKDIVNLEYDKNAKILLARRNLGFESTDEEIKGLANLNQWKAGEYKKIEDKRIEIIFQANEKNVELREQLYLALSDIDTNSYEFTTETEKKRIEFFTKISQQETERFISANSKRIDEYEVLNNALSDIEYGRYNDTVAYDQKLSIERITLNASMYEDLKGYGKEYFEAQKKLIEERAKLFRAAKIDEATITDWVALKTMEVQIEGAKNLADYYSQISGYEDKYRKNMFYWIDIEAEKRAEVYKDEIAAAKWAADKKREFDAKVTTDKINNIEDSMRITAGSFEQLSQLYKEDSNERRNLHNISMAFNIAEKAAAASKAVILAVEAIATQGLGDPYTAWPRIAAMTAAMAALLSSAGIAFGFGGGGGGGGAATTATPTLPASTVLGAIGGTGSESITKGWELLQDTFDMEYRELSNIYNEMKNLNANITGLVTSLVRTGGIGAAGVSTGFTPGRAESFIGNLPSTTSPLLTGGARYLLGNIGINLGNRIENWMASTLGSIIGGGIERSISGTGIAMGGASVRDLLAGGGIGAQAYTQVTEKHEGGWFGKDWYSGYKVYEELNENVSNMLDKVFKNISATLVSLAEGLGTDTTAAMNYIFEATEINLRGMNTEEINKTLSEYFSKIGDLAVETLFGDMLKGYQEINEGLLETATRLLIDKAVVISILEMTNKSFTGTTAQAIEFSEALIDIAGDFEKLQEAAQTYYDAFFSDTEKQARLQMQLSEQMTAMNLTLPDTRAGYRALVEGLDLTTQSGMEAYVALLDMAGAADQYYSTLEDAMEAAASASDNLAGSLGSLTLSLQEQMAQVSAAWGGPPVTGHAAGGLTRGVSIAGESGPEWIVPTYEPQKSSFLRDIGISPEAIGKTIVNYISHGYAPQTGPTYFAGVGGGINRGENAGGKSQTINFTWSGNIISTDKSPERIAKEIVRPLKAELRRLEAIGTA